MSRSKRRSYWSIADSTKDWKRSYHQSMRSKIRMQIHDNPEDLPNIVNKNSYSNVYDSPRDGSQQYVNKDELSIFYKDKPWKLIRK